VRRRAVQVREQSILVVGTESVGKSQLVASLTGAMPYVSSFRGSTVACETYRADGRVLVDTPGILRLSDAETTRSALERLEASDTVLLVAQATHLDDDLADLLPLVRGKRGLLVVTFWDKTHEIPDARQALDRLGDETGLAVVAVDARCLTETERSQILDELGRARRFPVRPPVERAGWRIEPRPTLLERPVLGPIAAVLLLLLPAGFAVWAANHIAEFVDPIVQAMVAPALPILTALPSLAAEILAGRYGLVTMAPLLFVWAVPTGVYLAGVLLPCLVTALTIAREQNARFALRMLMRQALGTVAFALLLAWGGALLGS
jgi:ferrous iron transport protein B